MRYRETERKVYVPYEKEVTEHKAPTDESVRLLNEMEAKARRNIISKIDIQDNPLHGIGITYYEDFPNDRFVYHVKFTLNGREAFIEATINRRDVKWLHEDKMREMIKEKIAKVIVEFGFQNL